MEQEQVVAFIIGLMVPIILMLMMPDDIGDE